MNPRNAGAAVVETLAAHGVDTVFGIPGTHNLEIFRHLADAGITPVTTRHEQGAGYAAEAYARVSGRPGVVITTSGPAITNAMTAAATAYAESQPVLFLSSGMPTGAEGRDLGQLHEIRNATGAMAELIERSHRVPSADGAAAAVTEAFASFAGRRPRPVHIEVPIDVLEQPWAGQARVAPVAAAPRADAGAVRRAADLLAAAARPMIIAGGGAVDAQSDLAETLGAPVATTVNGKGVVDESHALSVGASVRLPALQKAAAESDALLVVGSELGDSDLWGGRIRGRTVIRCDIEAGQLDKNCPADVSLLGDAGATVASVLADAVLAGDSSQVTYFGSVHYFDVTAPRRFCYTPGYATLGYGLPAGLGASLARPGSPVAVLIGDGALMFAVQELATLVEQRLPVPVVVVDNGGYREIRDQEASRGIPPVGVDLHVPDLAALGVAMGARGVRTTSSADLPGLVSGALSADCPTLVHYEIR